MQPTNEDIIGAVALGVFALGFIALGWAYLRKKKKERLEVFEKASLEANEAHGLDDYVDGKKQPASLPEHTESEAAVVPKADDLQKAEVEAKKAKAAEERAARERQRAEEEAAQAEADERVAAEEKLEAAKQKELDAKAEADAALARAKQLRAALKKTRDGFVGKIKKALAGSDEDDALDDLEAALFTADIGTRTAERLLEEVKSKLKPKEHSDAAKVTAVIKDEVVKILSKAENAPLDLEGDKPRVMMILGVNGAGKTTSIGKLTHQIKKDGKSVLLGAGDTFRAAAAEQLAVWAERNDCPIVMSDKDGADPASVLFDAVKKAQDDSVDVVICDTAGRLHTKVNLMDELEKVARVLKKAQPGAPHEALLVLDATVGQNAIQQAKQFGDAIPLTGIVLTKLDGTAKGGVIIGIADELKIPVRYIGVGEQIEDLRPFDPEQFVDALFGDTDLERSAA